MIVPLNCLGYGINRGAAESVFFSGRLYRTRLTNPRLPDSLVCTALTAAAVPDRAHSCKNRGTSILAWYFYWIGCSEHVLHI